MTTGPWTIRRASRWSRSVEFATKFTIGWLRLLTSTAGVGRHLRCEFRKVKPGLVAIQLTARFQMMTGGTLAARRGPGKTRRSLCIESSRSSIRTAAKRVCRRRARRCAALRGGRSILAPVTDQSWKPQVLLQRRQPPQPRRQAQALRARPSTSSRRLPWCGSRQPRTVPPSQTRLS